MTLLSPYNFAACDTNRVKLFGGNIVQIPSDQGAPDGSLVGGLPYTFYWHYQNWATVFPKWIVPQLKRWQAIGANTVRIQGGVNGVLAGYYTQSYYESCLIQLLAQYRALGLWMGQCQLGVAGYNNVVKPGGSVAVLADYEAALASIYTNVYLPNQDIIAYIEAGNQETAGADVAMSISLAQYAKGLGTIPVILSTSSSQAGANYNGVAVDAISTHWYPNGDYSPTDLQSTINQLLTCQKSYSGNIPNFIEECNIHGGVGSGGIYQTKSDLFDSLFRACYYHPDCAGLLVWGGYGNDVDAYGSTPLWGDWTIFQPPAGAGTDGVSDYNPNLNWADTVASLKVQGFGAKNRNMSASLSLPTSAVISSGVSLLNLTAATGSVSNPTAAGFSFATRFRKTVGVTAKGNINTSAPTVLYLYARDYSTSALTLIASATVSGNAAISLSGSLAPNANGVILELRASAASGAVISTLTATISTGNAPAATSVTPLPIAPPSLMRSLSRPLGQCKRA